MEPGTPSPAEGQALSDRRQQEDAEALARYEEELLQEARQIVAGTTLKLPTLDHVRVLLAVIDGRAPQPARRPTPMVQDPPF